MRLDDEQYETVKNVKLENIYDLQKEDKKTTKSLNDLDKMLQTYDGKDKDALMENFKKMSSEHTKRSEEERKKREKKEQKENTVKLQKLIKDKNVIIYSTGVSLLRSGVDVMINSIENNPLIS